SATEVLVLYPIKATSTVYFLRGRFLMIKSPLSSVITPVITWSFSLRTIVAYGIPSFKVWSKTCPEILPLFCANALNVHKNDMSKIRFFIHNDVWLLFFVVPQ